MMQITAPHFCAGVVLGTDNIRVVRTAPIPALHAGVDPTAGARLLRQQALDGRAHRASLLEFLNKAGCPERQGGCAVNAVLFKLRGFESHPGRQKQTIRFCAAKPQAWVTL